MQNASSFFRTEYKWILKGWCCCSLLVLNFDLYPKLLYLLMVVPAALFGLQLRPEKLYVCLPMAYIFSDAFIHKAILYQMFYIAELWVSFKRLQVYCTCINALLCTKSNKVSD